MDVSDVAVRHAIAFSTFNIKHSIDLSPSTLSVVREVRIGVVVIVLGLTVASIAKSVLASRKSEQQRSC